MQKHLKQPPPDESGCCPLLATAGLLAVLSLQDNALAQPNLDGKPSAAKHMGGVPHHVTSMD